MKKKTVEIEEVIQETDETKKKQLYNQYVEENTKKYNWFSNLWKAYLVGGLICTIGQVFTNYFSSRGTDEKTAALYTILVLVLTSVVLTGLGVYQKLARFAGAGTVVPITGFANSVASPAVEYKAEGQVFGIGCKIFTIAGPVILYGIFASWILGAIYWILSLAGR